MWWWWWWWWSFSFLADGAHYGNAQYSVVCFSLRFQNQNKSPLDHSFFNIHTRTLRSTLSIRVFFFQCLFGVCVCVRVCVCPLSVVRKSDSHMNGGRCAYECLYKFWMRCHLPIYDVELCAMLCCAVHFWQTIQMLETMQPMPSVCQCSVFVHLHSDWVCWRFRNELIHFMCRKKNILNASKFEVKWILTPKTEILNSKFFTGQFVRIRRIARKIYSEKPNARANFMVHSYSENMCIAHSLATALCIVHVSVCFETCRTTYTHTTTTSLSAM